jgi:protein-disulfide isomerase
LPQIEQNYIATGQVVYIFWNLPLPPSMHPQAQIAAEAAACAGEQGKYWPMHDQIFNNQSEWSGKDNALSILLGYGASVGLDQAAYQSCMSDHKTAQEIQDQAAFANSVGISGTPFFVFNSGGKLYAINGAQPWENFKQAIDTLLQGQP